MIKLKRIYEPASAEDGFRIFIDRLWPGGLKKEDADIDLWMKDIAHSFLLKDWFDQDQGKWWLFETRYTEELASNPAVMAMLEEYQKHQTITLLYAASDQEHNHAIVLRNFLNRIIG
ncbi:DUF488 domain-containing protein [Pedobacter cryoconitis]|uniref:Uncharacterized protein YeaO (DUF488 family) n=1 Tax=Pedobacter cryoconitis TaxID=188932 RepID=A0A7X0J3Y8_9SPHI|nr:DUF488 family protein [Pedobacter cryoconitis]MBB6499362.1 uncharacterized protein YeaO (DUF488 family) [Pedobacter cryoconitis]